MKVMHAAGFAVHGSRPRPALGMETCGMRRFRCRSLRPGGAIDIRVITAESEEDVHARLVAMGLEKITIEMVGPSLLQTLASRLAKRPPLPRSVPNFKCPVISSRVRMISICLVASIPVSIAVGAWSMTFVARQDAQKLAQAAALNIDARREAILAEEARPVTSRLLAAPSISDLIQRLSATLPAGDTVADAARDAHGILTIDIETIDPDELRRALARDAKLAKLRETGQSATDRGTMRVTLRGMEP